MYKEGPLSLLLFGCFRSQDPRAAARQLPGMPRLRFLAAEGTLGPVPLWEFFEKKQKLFVESSAQPMLEEKELG